MLEAKPLYCLLPGDGRRDPDPPHPPRRTRRACRGRLPVAIPQPPGGFASWTSTRSARRSLQPPASNRHGCKKSALSLGGRLSHLGLARLPRARSRQLRLACLPVLTAELGRSGTRCCCSGGRAPRAPRFAARTNLALKLQDPPRSAREAPSKGPAGSVAGSAV